MASSNNQNSARREFVDFNLLGALWLVLQYRRLLIGLGLAALILSATYAFLAPKTYTSTARLVVPEASPSSFLGGLDELSRLTGRNLDGTNGELYVGIARSRSVADPVMERFHLQEVYQVQFLDDAYRVLNRMLDITFDSRQSLLTLQVSDRDAQRAADLANALVDELEHRSIDLNLRSAQKERTFLEERLADVKQKLAAAEEALKQFQADNKVFNLDGQAEATLEAFAQLRGILASKEIESKVLAIYQTELSPERRALQEEIEQLREQIDALENSPAGQKLNPDALVAMGQIPELGLRYGRLRRDFKVQEVLFELLAKQYELARVKEVKTTTPLQILDRATPPERKSAPKRLFIMLLATCSTLFLTTVGIFFWEAWQRMTASNQELWDQIKGQLLRKRKK
jgi:uncharacterized protein involved in exopolysaccharide biosynthesis